VQLQSREVGNHIYHPSGAHAQLRNAMLAAKTPDEFYDTLAWLYGGSGLSEDPVAAAGAVGTARAHAA
jgi:salicylate hydroxylase